MARLSKEERKKRIKIVQAQEQADLLVSMPLSPDQLDALLNYLDAKLQSCDHSTRIAESFLRGEQLDPMQVLPWLAEHGGYCDCEVLFNLSDLAGSLRPDSPPPPRRPKQNRVARDLTNGMGWDIKDLPQPWRVANLYNPSEPLRLQLGKKGRCTITLIEEAVEVTESENDDEWIALWQARTQLPQRAPCRVEYSGMQLPDSLSSVVVDCPSWTPVFAG